MTFDTPKQNAESVSVDNAEVQSITSRDFNNIEACYFSLIVTANLATAQFGDSAKHYTTQQPP